MHNRKSAEDVKPVVTTHRVPTISLKEMTDEDILNAIKEKRFVSAKREITSRLLRHPQKKFYRVLNAFYLLSTGSAKEALEECNSIKATVPSDPSSLDLLYEVYCKLGRKSDAQSVYEVAAKKYPSPELLLIWYDKAKQLFDAQMMQRSSAALKKAAPSNRAYQLQSAFADLIWSSETKSEKEAQQLLDSASKVMGKLQPFQNNQEAFLFSSILMKKSDYEQVVQVLEPLQNKELELILMFLDALDKSEQWDKLYQYSQNLLFSQKFNDYDTWKYLIKAGKALEKPLNELTSLIKFDSRNSYVANMEISRVYGSNIDQAMETYFEKFQTKPCCSSDLLAFDINDSFKSKLVAKKQSLLQSSNLSDDNAVICMNIEKILSRLDQSEIKWDSFAKYDNPELSDLYIASMIQSLSRDLSTTKVFEHIIQLEKLAENDPDNFNIKLWLLNLYSTISGSVMALETYGDLKIKMIQHDIMGYKLNLEPSIRNLNQLIQIFRFYLTSDSEISAYFGVALNKGLFTKIEDLYRFGKRLNNSIYRHLLILQILKMCRMLNNEYYKYFENLLNEKKAEILSDWFSISDNRDFDTDYKLGFEFEAKVMFNSERKKSKEYVQLFYLKELLITETHDAEIEKLLKLLEKWLSNPKYTTSLSLSEVYFFKILHAIFKLTKRSAVKEKDQLLRFLEKNLDFKKVTQEFLAKTSPLSSSANRILVDSLELVKLINLLSGDERLLVLAKKFQQGLVQYIVTNPEMTHFKEIKGSLDLGQLPKSFVDAQLDRLEDGLRASKFKMR